MKFLLDVAYFFAAVAVSPMVVYRMLKQNRYKTGWAQRFGKVTRKYPAKKCIFIHAVSVGEVNATTTIIKALEQKFSDFEIVISTTTDTGFARANTLYGTKHTIIYFPFDFSWIRRRSLNNLKPSLCMFVELEVWPNFVEIATEMNIPVVVINGRLSERSSRRYKKIKSLTAKTFQKLTLVLAQSEEYAQRFKELGCPADKVCVVGSLKYDTAQITDKIDGAEKLIELLNLKKQRIWVAGGTGDNEEQIILEVYSKLLEQRHFNDLRLVVVPRKPERFDEVAQQIKQAGFPLIRYSQIKQQNTAVPCTDTQTVILVDTIGDLRKFYSIADIVFVGRSLVPFGGSDMMEAAAFGKCTLFGPHTYNFKQTVDDLLNNNGALLVNNKNDLFEKIQKCLLEPEFAKNIARNGQQVIRNNQGATAKTIETISKFLN